MKLETVRSDIVKFEAAAALWGAAAASLFKGASLLRKNLL